MNICNGSLWTLLHGYLLLSFLELFFYLLHNRIHSYVQHDHPLRSLNRIISLIYLETNKKASAILAKAYLIYSFSRNIKLSVTRQCNGHLVCTDSKVNS